MLTARCSNEFLSKKTTFNIFLFIEKYDANHSVKAENNAKRLNLILSNSYAVVTF